MKRPTKLISKLRNGCDLSVKDEFDVYWYIKCLEEKSEKAEMKLEELAEQYCHWYQQDFQECETWQTSCGDKLFNVLNGTPKENGMHFCPYCGKNIIEHDYNEQIANEEEECDDSWINDDI